MTKNKNYPIILLSLLISAVSIFICVSAYGDRTAEHDAAAFEDVSEGDWFHSDVLYVYEKGLMSGTAEGVFSPNETMTRAMLVTVLWRLEGKPEGEKSHFADVAEGTYYNTAVAWAFKENIVSGYDSESFCPDNAVTREQLAAIIFRYAKYKNYDVSANTDVSRYADAGRISSYALPAFEWANAQGIITGSSETTLNPEGNASRCQVAAILRRFADQYTTEESNRDTTQTDEVAAAVGGGGSSGTGGSRKTNSSHGDPAQQDQTSETENVSTVPDAVISLSDVEAKAGDVVTVYATIDDNPGILGMTLSISFDENALTLESAVNGEAFKGVLELTTSKELKSGSNFVWDGVDISAEQIKNGTILELKFRVSEGVGEGTYPINIENKAGGAVDSSLKNVGLQFKAGCVEVKK